VETSPSGDEILNKAEQAMYIAKNGGKNRIERVVIVGQKESICTQHIQLKENVKRGHK